MTNFEIVTQGAEELADFLTINDVTLYVSFLRIYGVKCTEDTINDFRRHQREFTLNWLNQESEASGND